MQYQSDDLKFKSLEIQFITKIFSLSSFRKSSYIPLQIIPIPEDSNPNFEKFAFLTIDEIIIASFKLENLETLTNSDSD
jgi:hypothetical protein